MHHYGDRLKWTGNFTNERSSFEQSFFPSQIDEQLFGRRLYSVRMLGFPFEISKPCSPPQVRVCSCDCCHRMTSESEPSTDAVFTDSRLTITASCPMNLQYFPMDRQLCHIEIESCEYRIVANLFENDYKPSFCGFGIDAQKWPSAKYLNDHKHSGILLSGIKYKFIQRFLCYNLHLLSQNYPTKFILGKTYNILLGRLLKTSGIVLSGIKHKLFSTFSIVSIVSKLSNFNYFG